MANTIKGLKDIDRPLGYVEKILAFVKRQTPPPLEPLPLIIVIGTSGSGKTAAMYELIHRAEQAKTSLPICYVRDHRRLLGLVVPDRFTIVGKYVRVCGGADTLATTEDVRYVLHILWPFPLPLIVEGALMGGCLLGHLDWIDVRSKVFSGLEREVTVVHLYASPKVCLERIHNRTGRPTTPIVVGNMENKRHAAEVNAHKSVKRGIRVLELDTTRLSVEDVADWFEGQFGTHDLRGGQVYAN